jgi:hypothetical protein
MNMAGDPISTTAQIERWREARKALAGRGIDKFGEAFHGELSQQLGKAIAAALHEVLPKFPGDEVIDRDEWFEEK